MFKFEQHIIHYSYGIFLVVYACYRVLLVLCIMVYESYMYKNTKFFVILHIVCESFKIFPKHF